MSSMTGFRPVAEVVADNRSRIAFGRAGVRADDRFAVAINDEGEILLTPLASIPRRELLVWEDEALRASLARGLADSAAGRTASRGSFAAYLDSEETDYDME